MFEVEVKFRLRDREEAERVRECLERIDAKLLEDVVEEDLYFSHPCRDFSKTDEALRVRALRRGTLEEIFLTYKGPRLGSEAKTRREATVQVDNRDVLLEILESLGFRPVARVRKRRLVYTKENYTITLDEVDGLGYFVEIEVVTDSEDLADRCVRDILNFASTLGLGEDRIERRTYLEMLLEKTVS